MRTSFSLLVFAILMLLASAAHGTGQLTYSLVPLPVFPGQPAFLRIDDSTGCFHFDQQVVQRNGDHVTVTIDASDFFQTPCPAGNVTPLQLPLGSFPAGSYRVDVNVCALVAPPEDPCRIEAQFTLGVGTGGRPATTIPTLGIVALALSCSGIFALAFTGRRRATRR